MGRSLVCALLWVGFTPSASWAQAREVTPVVQGYIGGYWLRDEPLVGAHVLLARGEDVWCRHPLLAVRTDSAGRFTIPSVELPPHRAPARRPGHAWGLCLPLPSDTIPSDTTLPAHRYFDHTRIVQALTRFNSTVTRITEYATSAPISRRQAV